MKIVTDKKTLRRLNLEHDPTHTGPDGDVRDKVGPAYDIRYFDGCFYPFLVEKE